jgi:hypothetical protein
MTEKFAEIVMTLRMITDKLDTANKCLNEMADELAFIKGRIT